MIRHGGECLAGKQVETITTKRKKVFMIWMILGVLVLFLSYVAVQGIRASHGRAKRIDVFRL